MNNIWKLNFLSPLFFFFTRYAYSPAKFPPHPQSTTVDRKPAYANRYYNNNGRAALGRGSESSFVEPRPPDTLFAVSGGGELYINRLAEYDDERNDDYRPSSERQYGRARGAHTNNGPPAREFNNEYPARSQNGDAADARRRPGNGQTFISNGTQQRSKLEEHPVLPEYVRKPAKPSEDETEDIEDDLPEKQSLDSSDSDNSGHKGNKAKKKRSSSTKSKDRTSAGKSHKNDKKSKSSSRESDQEGKHRHRSSSKKKSKKGNKSEDSDAESTHRSRHSSSSKSKSKHRSKSRDLNTSRESFDSNISGARGRSGSRSRRRSRSRSRDRGLDDDRRSRKRSGSREGKSTKKGKAASSAKSDYWSDDMSEVSTKRKGRTAEAKVRARDYSDGESIRGRSTAKSKSAQGTDHRPKTSYSSYYEY